MDREAALKLIRALVNSGFVPDDQRMDVAIDKIGFQAGLNPKQLKAAWSYAIEQRWIAETDKAAWSIVTQAGADAVKQQ
jgi:hypothetical protein